MSAVSSLCKFQWASGLFPILMMLKARCKIIMWNWKPHSLKGLTFGVNVGCT